MSKRAVILAGGKGTRLKPYTIAFPKPLVPVGDVPILEIIIRQLKEYGFDHITISLNHFADVLKAYFGDGVKWGLCIDYSFEETSLSTMGPLKLIPDLPENFIVMNGDILTDLNYAEFLQQHENKKSNFTIAAHRRKHQLEYGVLEADSNQKLVGFHEKPISEYLVSMGIYAVNKSNLDFIPSQTFFGFDHLMSRLIEEKLYPTVYEYSGYWLDIGRPDDYEKAILDSKQRSFFK